MMRAWELIKETLLRHYYIGAAHALLLGIYVAANFSEKILGSPYGPKVFIWSGCVLPLIVSAGIFGDDLATGRIATLITKPIRPCGIYLWRYLGMSAQGLVHLLLVAAILPAHRACTNFGGVFGFDGWTGWIIASWLAFNMWIALNTTLSVFLKRGMNSAFIVAAYPIVTFGTINVLHNFNPKHRVYITASKIFEYGFPPWHATLTQFRDSSYQVSFAVCTVLLILAYGTLGIAILSKREYRQERG